MYFRPNRYRLNSGFILNVHTNKGKWVKTVNFLLNFISPDYRYELKSYKNSVEYAKSEYSYIYKSVKSIQLCSYKWQFTLHGKIYDHIRRTHVYWTYYSLRIIKVIKKKKYLKKYSSVKLLHVILYVWLDVVRKHVIFIHIYYFTNSYV